MNFQMFKLVSEKAEEPEIKLPTSTGSLKKQETELGGGETRQWYLYELDMGYAMILI